MGKPLNGTNNGRNINGQDVRAVGTAGSTDVSEAVRDVMSRWQGPVDLVRADAQGTQCTTRYGTVFVVFDGRVAVSWCTSDEHSFDAQTGMCIESSDGRMKGWRIVPWEMHRFNAKDAEAYVKARGVSIAWTADERGPGRMTTGAAVAADTADELSAHTAAEERFRAGAGRNDARAAGVTVTVDSNKIAEAVAAAKTSDERGVGRTLILLSDIFTVHEGHAAAIAIAKLDGRIANVWQDVMVDIHRIGSSILGNRYDRIILMDDALSWIGDPNSLQGKWMHLHVQPRKTFNCTTTFVSMNAVISALRNAHNTSTRPSDSSPPPPARATDNLQQ